jgi:hypothetical protein
MQRAEDQDGHGDEFEPPHPHQHHQHGLAVPAELAALVRRWRTRWRERGGISLDTVVAGFS